MNELFKYSFVMLFGVFISSVSQVLLKKAAERKYESVIKEYLNVRVITAYLIFFISTLLTIIAYKAVPMSMGQILEATGYIYVTIFGAVIFKERITGRKLVSLGLILAGVVIFSLSAV